MILDLLHSIHLKISYHNFHYEYDMQVRLHNRHRLVLVQIHRHKGSYIYIRQTNPPKLSKMEYYLWSYILIILIKFKVHYFVLSIPPQTLNNVKHFKNFSINKFILLIYFDIFMFMFMFMFIVLSITPSSLS